MKLTELTDKDCIHVKNEKQAKKIAKMLKSVSGKYAKELVEVAFKCYSDNTYISIHQNVLFYGDISIAKENGLNIIPASKFIKKKKKCKCEKEITERLNDNWAKHARKLENELSAFGKAIDDYNNLTNNIKVNDAETVKPITPGKWYKTENSLFFYEGENEINYDSESLRGYGFVEGEWVGTDSHDEIYNGWSHSSGWVEATEEEVLSALTKEAQRRYKFKQEIKEINHHKNGSVFECNPTIGGAYDFKDGCLFSIGYGKWCVFKYGKWATLSEPNDLTSNEPIADEIDWNKAGQLVIGINNEIVLTLGDELGKGFYGVIIMPYIKHYPLGTVSRNWIKRNFKPFKGEITLKN